jgi:hypothetical protein
MDGPRVLEHSSLSGRQSDTSGLLIRPGGAGGSGGDAGDRSTHHHGRDRHTSRRPSDGYRLRRHQSVKRGSDGPGIPGMSALMQSGPGRPNGGQSLDLNVALAAAAAAAATGAVAAPQEKLRQQQLGAATRDIKGALRGSKQVRHADEVGSPGAGGGGTGSSTAPPPGSTSPGASNTAAVGENDRLIL